MRSESTIDIHGRAHTIETSTTSLRQHRHSPLAVVHFPRSTERCDRPHVFGSGVSFTHRVRRGSCRWRKRCAALFISATQPGSRPDQVCVPSLDQTATEQPHVVVECLTSTQARKRRRFRPDFLMIQFSLGPNGGPGINTGLCASNFIGFLHVYFQPTPRRANRGEAYSVRYCFCFLKEFAVISD